MIRYMDVKKEAALEWAALLLKGDQCLALPKELFHAGSVSRTVLVPSASMR